MDFTSFDKLRLSIKKLGASPVVANLDKSLTGIGVSVDDHADNLVIGEDGIYYVDPSGVLTKAVIHIVDKNVSGRYGGDLEARLGSKQFDDDAVIKDLHKYHLMKCAAIERAEAEGWRKERYFLSRSQDGYFYYRFLKNNDVLLTRDKATRQRLYACKLCLSKLGYLTNKTYKRETFQLKEFLYSDDSELVNVDQKGSYADQCSPNVYRKDWPAISRVYKNLKNYQCEQSDCPCPDLSNQQYRKYLHTHHVSFDKSNNNYSNLTALCIYCHANQSHHSHMKKIPDYKAYVCLRGIS